MKTKFSLALGLMLSASTALAAGNGSGVSPTASAGYAITAQVSDQAGVAANQDTDLVNPWGLAQLGDSAPVWVSDNATNKSTFYDRTTGVKQSPVVAVSPGAPTGIVGVPSGSGFSVKKNGKSGASFFLFDTQSGAILGWAPSLDPNNAILAYNGASKGAVYTGLALDPATKLLFAANFAKNQVQIFNNKFKLVGHFTDPGVPKTFGPFSVEVINGSVYVAFAARKADGFHQRPGKSLGYVDVFNTAGQLQKQLVKGGPLNAPWGVTIAPSGFGTFAGDLLVGNFGNGQINAFDPNTGASLGTLNDSNGKTIAIDGLWALDNGPGATNVQFSSGPSGGTHGLLGLIAPN